MKRRKQSRASGSTEEGSIMNRVTTQEDLSVFEPAMNYPRLPNSATRVEAGAHDAVRESEERYRALVAISPDAVMLTNLDGKVIECNLQTAHLFGLDNPQEAIGRDYFEFIAPEDMQHAAENLIKAYETGSIRNAGCTLLKKNGARFPAELSIALLRDNTCKPVGFITVVRDFSYAERIEQTWADFVHAVSHDLKSPLSSIIGWSVLLQKGDPLSEKAAKFVERILKASETTIAMINQWLDVASLTEATKLHLVLCDLEQLVAKAVSDLDGAALVKSLKVDFRIVGRPYPILADEMRLFRSVLNLLDNAIKYSFDGASIVVTLIFESEKVTIRIHDGGPGIPEAELPHLFEKYYRGQYAANKKNGVGLGLATVQAVVMAHDGTVSARNVNGMGAEFTVTLPTGPAVQIPLDLPRS